MRGMTEKSSEFPLIITYKPKKTGSSSSSFFLCGWSSARNVIRSLYTRTDKLNRHLVIIYKDWHLLYIIDIYIGRGECQYRLTTRLRKFSLKKKLVGKREEEETCNILVRKQSPNSGFEMPTRLSSWDRLLARVYSHAAGNSTSIGEMLLFPSLSIYLFRNDCPRNCGTGTPWAHREVVVFLPCAVWGPSLFSQQKPHDHQTRERKKVKRAPTK